ncbi:MAG: TonB-dependent receptor [Nitrospina sp.]|nr:TonB-dependent receptor [Nitrospina sp.]MBT3511358.1 TonB-dependent receptor [Nitrospina sp.]MBT3875152.1 TonB-dependent receptor [Nitrospina sp.]MBT4047418.1 TonB-dependent receptor [Nitrospina sp.]MBT4556015.1 TonB-dependent receptor [Nitrospina sp.]
MIKVLFSLISTLILLLQIFSICWAQNDAHRESAEKTFPPVLELNELLVTPSVLNFDFSSDTSSRLDLPVFETPASITVINNSELKRGGYQEVGKVLERSPGFVWGNPPAEPANYSMRGFTSNQVMIQRDGIWLGPALITGRPQNGFNLDRIEVLKGPASVLHGQGAIGATLNMVTKKPEMGNSNSYEILSSYGRYDTVKAGVGAGGPMGKNLWFRIDGSEYSSDGYVDNADPKSRNFIGSVLWKPNDQLDVTFGVDFLDDKLQNYWGTPLVTEAFATQPLTGVVSTTDGRTIDKRTQFVNYNISDEVADSYQMLTTLDLSWKHSNKLSFRNYTYFLNADREWRNSEQYTFNSTTNLIDRDRFFVAHEQITVGNRMSAKYKNTFAGMENQYLVGIDSSYVDFERKSQPLSNVTSVDPFSVTLPSQDTFGNSPASFRLNPTRIISVATFFEDTLKVSPKLRLVAGLRQDHIELFRLNFNDPTPGESFEKTFNPFSWRLGAVYEIAPSWNAYIQMSSGTDPLGDDVFLVTSSQNFDLSTSQQWEMGLKSRLLDGRAEMAVAVYHIERQNTLIKDSNDSVLGGDGSQRSTGFELEGSFLVTPKWRVGANTAYTDAEFGVFENVSGNTPSNVPEWVANAWTNYSRVAGLPIDVGGSFRYVDDRFNDRFNTVKMLAYQTVDIHATYRSGNGRYTARLTNLFDKAYALWGDEFYNNQLILGSPRSFEISAQFDF